MRQQQLSLLIPPRLAWVLQCLGKASKQPPLSSVPSQLLAHYYKSNAMVLLSTLDCCTPLQHCLLT